MGSPKLKKVFLQNVIVSISEDSDGEKKIQWITTKFGISLLNTYANTDAQELFLKIFENPSYF